MARVKHRLSQYAVAATGVFGFGARLQIRARAETAARAGDDDRPHVRVILGLAHHLCDFLAHGVVEGIEPVWPVEGEDASVFANFPGDGFVHF